MEEQKQNKKESIADASQKISDNKEACKSHSSVFFSKAQQNLFRVHFTSELELRRNIEQFEGLRQESTQVD